MPLMITVINCSDDSMKTGKNYELDFTKKKEISQEVEDLLKRCIASSLGPRAMGCN